MAHDFNNLLTGDSGHCDLIAPPPRRIVTPINGDLIQIHQKRQPGGEPRGTALAFLAQTNLQLELLDLRDNDCRASRTC